MVISRSNCTVLDYHVSVIEAIKSTIDLNYLIKRAHIAKIYPKPLAF